MLELNKNNRQFVIEQGEDTALRRELEKAFIALDEWTSGGQYTMSNMRRTQPMLAKLFDCLRRV